MLNIFCLGKKVCKIERCNLEILIFKTKTCSLVKRESYQKLSIKIYQLKFELK